MRRAAQERGENLTDLSALDRPAERSQGCADCLLSQAFSNGSDLNKTRCGGFGAGLSTSLGRARSLFESHQALAAG
jgi:hypothetical protein